MTTMTESTDSTGSIAALDPEDQKLVVLARGARSRIGADQGAAVRDSTGRTYSSANVTLDQAQLSAATLALAQGLASGAQGIEAVVVCADAAIDDFDGNLLANVARGAKYFRVTLSGDVCEEYDF